MVTHFECNTKVLYIKVLTYTSRLASFLISYQGGHKFDLHRCRIKPFVDNTGGSDYSDEWIEAALEGLPFPSSAVLEYHLYTIYIYI